MNAAMPMLQGTAPMPTDVKSADAVREYDAKIDTKKRLTLLGSLYDYYHVKEFSNGKIELEPRVLASPFEIAEDTLEMIKVSAENFKKGVVSEPVDLTEFDGEESLSGFED